jgi:hypothetical protein
LQQKLLGPTAVCPEGQFAFEHAALAASAATVQHRPFTWMPGFGQLGTQRPSAAFRS